MTPAAIARLAALAPAPPDPARCAACGGRCAPLVPWSVECGALYCCRGCGAAWWAQGGTRDAVCGPDGVPAVEAPLVRPAKPARLYPFVCCACQRDVSRVYTTGHCISCYRAAIRAGELIPQGAPKPAKRGAA